MSKHLNIILANAPINNGNRGCVALSYTALYLIDRVLSENGISYTCYMPNSGFVDSEKHTINFGDKILEYYPLSYYCAVTTRDEITMKVKRLLGKNKSKKVFQKADFILDIGQGDSFADIYGTQRFAQIDRIHCIARDLKKPYCILPQTIGPFKDDYIRSKAIESIREASLVMARDKQSFDYVRQNAPDVALKEYIDVAFFLPYTKKEFSKDYIHVGLNVSALLWHGGYTNNNQFGLKIDYQQTIRSIIDYFLGMLNVKVHLIPHVVHGERVIENDYEISFDIVEEYNNDNLVLAPYFLDPIIAKSYISGMDFFMGARMHSTIGAFSSGVPVVPMAYSRKFNGLFCDTLDYNYLADLKSMTSDEILNVIQDSFSQRNQLKEIVKDRMNCIVKSREALMCLELKKYFKL